MSNINKFRQMRLARAWSQEQLAEMAGLSTRTVQRIENGEQP
ncbi:helix-turn-helix transcriptional regulator, partial [Salmonella enterica]|nr:helix-turn-helix transcriptional regulator [Salmonella enterica]